MHRFCGDGSDCPKPGERLPPELAILGVVSLIERIQFPREGLSPGLMTFVFEEGGATASVQSGCRRSVDAGL